MTVEQYKRVIEAFASGEIDKAEWVLVFGNDSGNWSYRGPDYTEERDDEFFEKGEAMGEKYGTPDGYVDLVELAKAAGIPAEWC
ncbi:MAG TPA: hypothetical protein VMW24_09480 [Sedimentisphaerales bacterium]|nr:hypothetical protein [Sedimentisphaerales bacterium]